MTLILDQRLENDTYGVAETDDVWVRLHKNAIVPWLIVVPKTTEIELFACSDDYKQRVREVVDNLAAFLHAYFAADKMNIATIGNIVSQLHIHIIVRHHDDFAWPAPVWGKPTFLPYDTDRKSAIIHAIQQFLTETHP